MESMEISKYNGLQKWAKQEGTNKKETLFDPAETEKAAKEAIEKTRKEYMAQPAFKALKKDRAGVLDAWTDYFTNNAVVINQLANSRFMGYAFLSFLAQDAMISRGVKTLADEMTRQWGELVAKDKGKTPTEQEGKTPTEQVSDELKRVDAKGIFRKAATMTGFFGGCLVFLDVRTNPNEPATPEELETPLFVEGADELNRAKLLGKHLVALRPVEPINVAPGSYNSTDPTAPDFYEPEFFYVLGKKIHRSRFLYFADNIPPQILKPLYLFFGIPLAQLAFQYCQDFYKLKDVCTRILQKFSCTNFATDVDYLMSANGDNAMKERINTFAKYRDNDSVVVTDKNTEEVTQINTPISGLKEMWYASLELIPMIFGVPATKLLEISPSGFNSTGEFEMRNFYDSVHTKQVNVFDLPIHRLIDIVSYIKGFDTSLFNWNWNSLFKMSEKEQAEVNLTKANTAQVLVSIGAVDNAEVARQLVDDPDSGFNSLEIPDPIDPMAEAENVDPEELEGLQKDIEDAMPALGAVTPVSSVKDSIVDNAGKSNPKKDVLNISIDEGRPSISDSIKGYLKKIFSF